MCALGIFACSENGLGDFIVAVFDRENYRKRFCIHFSCEECDGLETCLALSGATNKRGIILNTIIVHQIAKWESVTKEDRLAGGAVDGFAIFFIKRLDLGNVGIGVLLVDSCVGGIKLGKFFGNFIDDYFGIFQ